VPLPLQTSVPALQVDEGASAVWRQLRAHGAVILKHAAQSPAAFESVTDRFADHFRIHQDPTRHRYNAADTTQSVSSGAAAIGLHAERAYLPARPELLFFCCLTPPTSGGATTLCDGAAIVDTLSSEDVRSLEAMTLRWRATLDKPRWQRMWSSEDRSEVLTRFAAAIQRHGEQARARYWFGESEPETEQETRSAPAPRRDMRDMDTLHVHYVTPALITGRLGGRQAFANYLLLAQDEPDGPSATQEDGAAIPRDLLARVGEAANALTIDIAWAQGDIAIIDNTRCMHGRRAFTGGPRQILVRMGDAIEAPGSQLLYTHK
jgi:alpha-ketoglutarate-dependent taurine dioxygenase